MNLATSHLPRIPNYRKLLLCCAEIMLSVSSTIVNLSLESGILPSRNRTGITTFLAIVGFKFISKVIVKVVAVRLQVYLDSHQLTEQSAYKSFHSCETALVRVEKEICLAIDNRLCVMLLLLDLCAAFDTVPEISVSFSIVLYQCSLMSILFLYLRSITFETFPV